MHLHDYRCTGCGRHYSHDHDNNKPPVCTTEDCPGGGMEFETFAFRCKNCGKLMRAVDAGENKVPNSCNACGAGIHIGYDAQQFHREMEALLPKGKAMTTKEVQELSRKLHAKISALPTKRTYFPDNFEILADLPDAELLKLGLGRARIAKHTPVAKTPRTDKPKNVIAVTTDGARGTDTSVGKVT